MAATSDSVSRRSVLHWTGAAFALPAAPFEPRFLEYGPMPFTPKFVDLVRNFTTVQGTGPVALGAAVSGYTSLAAALSSGDQFYYCIQSVDKPQEREVGRGTMQADGKIAREAMQGGLTHFSAGTKTIALVTAAEWFTRLDQAGAAGSSIEAANRAALAAAPATRGPAMLTERGREGLFAWDPSDHSAKVAADSRQGLHVPPAGDPSGASGAWVRKFVGPVNPLWFGLIEGDAAGANGAANSASLQAMLATLRARAVNADSAHQGAEMIQFPPGFYEFASTIDISDGTQIIAGADTGSTAGRGTILKFPAGVTGIRTQMHNTSGISTVDGVQHRSGSGCIIRSVALVGGFTSTEAEVHGIHLRARAHIENVYIEGFEGDGVHADTSASGNTNNTRFIGGRIEQCRNGLFIDGGDSNIWTVIGVDCSNNRQWGVKDSSFLGNSYFGCHTAANGLTAAAVALAPTVVSHGGNRYGVIVGQEAGASTNAPSGTTADNSWWYYIGAGDPDSVRPAWSSGTTYRAGGSYYSDNANAANLFSGCYAEKGQGLAQLIGPTLVAGGPLAAAVRGTAGTIRANTGGAVMVGALTATGTLRAEGDSAIIGTTTGGNLSVTLDNGNTSNTLTFRSTSGSTQTDGVITTSRSAGMFLQGYGAAGAPGNITLRSGSTNIARVKSTGFNVFGGFTYQVNDVAVVGARKTGWAVDTGTAKRTANATYAAGAGLVFGAAYSQAEHSALSTRLAAVEAALQAATETIKALKDDLHGTAGHGLIGT